MRALRPSWQRAALALFTTRGDRTEALRIAGYKDGKEQGRSGKGINVLAWRMFGDDRMRAAVRELAARLIETSEPELLALTFEIMRDNALGPRDRLTAIRMVWDRANPVLTKHKIEVEHHLSSDQLDVEHYRALQKLGAPQSAFFARFGHNGLARVEAMIVADDAKNKVIETNYQEVEIDGEE
jgi:hypothetical protein